jgi:hypothetical protein
MSDNIIQAQTRFERRLEQSAEAVARRHVVDRARESVLPKPTLIPDTEPDATKLS